MNLLHMVKEAGSRLSYQTIITIKQNFCKCMATYLVKNLHEGSRPGNWLLFWKKAVGVDEKTDVKCHRLLCNAIATDGAHVILADPKAPKDWYIVPLCHLHNCGTDDVFFVEGPLVPVNGGNILW